MTDGVKSSKVGKRKSQIDTFSLIPKINILNKLFPEFKFLIIIVRILLSIIFTIIFMIIGILEVYNIGGGK